MKKTKLFSALAIFAALSLVACNGGNNDKNSSTSKAATSASQKSSTSTSKAPTWGEWKVVKPATCAAEGVEERTNSIGEKETRPIPKTNQHTWVATPVAASGEGVDYEDIECSVCHSKGLRVATAKATLDGTDKGGAPEGCVKLSSNGNSMTVKINIPAAKSGKIYLTGAMDYWHDGNNSNETRTYASVKNSENTANFKLEVNDAEVDMTAMLEKTFGEMLPEEAGETVGSVTYSQIGDCEVGAVSLQAGLNTIKFTRVDSYNLAIKYFTVVYAA